MKLTNHTKKGSYNLSDGTYIQGTIKMTIPEYINLVCPFLARNLKHTQDTYARDCLMTCDFEAHKHHTLFSLGIFATKLIATHFGLKNYKDQNYAILVKML